MTTQKTNCALATSLHVIGVQKMNDYLMEQK